MDWIEVLGIALGAAAIAAAAIAIVRARRGRAFEPTAPAAEPTTPAPREPISRPAVEGEIDVETPGGLARIHFLTLGARDAKLPPIVLIHGLGGSIRHFADTIAPQLGADHHVVAFDRPGYGHSTRPSRGAASLSEQAAVLRQALARLEIERPVLVGHSFGGGVALAFALAYPETVSGVVLLAPAIYPFRMKPPLPDQTVDSPAARRMIAWTVGPMMARKNADMFLEAAFGPQSPPSDYETVGGGAFAARPSQIEATMEDGAILRPDLAAQSVRYGELAPPISILFGLADRIVTFEEHGPPLKAVAPHVELHTLEGVGHMLPFAAPDACVARIRAVAGSAAALKRWRG
ncbi:MAG: alpha/beta hydrolase [Neomegalonema sp.]|nr:alpha/beta hydrolase [Neomegalonema sp.]